MLIYDVLHKETVYHTIVNDLRSLGVKYRIKKSTFKTERFDGIKNISKRVFKIPLSYQPLDVVNLSSGGIVHVPVFVSQATTFLENCFNQEGLFRKAGSHLRQRELIARLDNGGTLGEKHHAIDIANCLKTFFRDLPEPLIPYPYHDLFVHCAMLKTSRVQALLLACILLPPHHLNTLAFFMEFLKRVSIHEKQNKMSIDNLAKVIGPNIMPLQETTMLAVQMRLELHLVVIKVLIENAENIGILPDHVTQAISMETLGSTDNELDVSQSSSRSKSRKKKHRSGSLTRKPHLSASNLNLRMFNGLKKIVGKGGIPEENNIIENQQVPTNDAASSCTSNVKSSKKRKVVERSDPSSTKKKRFVEKAEKSKKIRLSLDRFVSKAKPKLVDSDSESFANTANQYVERRWSSVSTSCDSKDKRRIYSEEPAQLILKDNGVPNVELQSEYNNVFVGADVNLSDDSDEQVLLGKKDYINANRHHAQLSSSSNEPKRVDDFDPFRSKKTMTINDFEGYSRVKIASPEDQSEEYVTIPKSEYEEIKNRVSAIESRLSQEFGCANDEEDNHLTAHSAKTVQTEYEKTLEESGIESTATADYLARKLGKELKIRRSGEHKIIRSPSARKIGNLRRRSQERIMSKRLRRTASWHISHGPDIQPRVEVDQKLNNVFPANEHKTFIVDYAKDNTYVRSTSIWEEEKNNAKLNNICKQFSSSDVHAASRINGSHNFNSLEVQSSKNRAHNSVRRVSSFHGNELTNTAMYLDRKIEQLKKTSSQQNVILNNTCLSKQNHKLENTCSKVPVSWKDAEGYFKSTNLVNTLGTQTGRASIAKLRTQNAGMVLAKAKLFDECTTKIHSQNNPSSRKQMSANSEELTKQKETNKEELLSQSCKRIESNLAEPCRKPNKNSKNINSKYNVEATRDRTLNIPSSTRQKENKTLKTPPMLKKASSNTISHDSQSSSYKPDASTLCRTPHIKKSLTVKTPKSSKALAKKSGTESRRTPLKAVGQLSTPKYQSPKSILKTRNLSRRA